MNNCATSLVNTLPIDKGTPFPISFFLPATLNQNQKASPAYHTIKTPTLTQCDLENTENSAFLFKNENNS
ncbi:hypothetical protein [uncultured Gammaproteobacteria bacterium]|jgi:hypothetical protein|nr:hypothetical protein [uncultured Gammaproteobacteria bacterium]